MEQYTYKQLRRMSTKQLINLRVKYAKRANQRLVRLERSESPVTGKPYTAGAYDLAVQYIKTTREDHSGKMRFSESANYTKYEEETGETAYDMYRIKRDILEMQRFLAAKSSTVSGNREIERKRIDTFAEQGISAEVASSDAFYDFLNSNAYEYFTANQFESETIVDIYNLYREAGVTARNIQEAFNKLKAQSIKKAKAGDDDEITVKDIQEALYNKGSKKTKKKLDELAKKKGGVLL